MYPFLPFKLHYRIRQHKNHPSQLETWLSKWKIKMNEVKFIMKLISSSMKIESLYSSTRYWYPFFYCPLLLSVIEMSNQNRSHRRTCFGRNSSSWSNPQPAHYVITPKLLHVITPKYSALKSRHFSQMFSSCDLSTYRKQLLPNLVVMSTIKAVLSSGWKAISKNLEGPSIIYTQFLLLNIFP